MTDCQPANISYSLQENKGAEMDVPTLSYDELLNEVTTSADAIPDQESESEYEYDYASGIEYRLNFVVIDHKGKKCKNSIIVEFEGP